jgi:hypothetical protein
MIMRHRLRVSPETAAQELTAMAMSTLALASNHHATVGLSQ